MGNAKLCSTWYRTIIEKLMVSYNATLNNDFSALGLETIFAILNVQTRFT